MKKVCEITLHAIAFRSILSPPTRTHVMKHRYIKIVITAKNQTQYFLGDGLWFGRISKDTFQAKLAAGCTIWETVSKHPSNVIQFAS